MVPWRLGDYVVPADTPVTMSILLLHHREDLYPEPFAFRPERWQDRKPGTYEWIPFGGGIRRCIGATFAHMELDVVLRVMLERVALEPTDAPDESWRFKGVAWSPGAGGRVTVHARSSRARVPEVAAAA
jgi:cytochrome P450